MGTIDAIIVENNKTIFWQWGTFPREPGWKRNTTISCSKDAQVK